MFRGKIENLLAYNFRGFIDRISRVDCAATRKRPRAPIELVGVTRDDIDLIHAHAKLLGDDLREAREVTLSLRAHACDNRDASAAHHLYLGAFIWADASAFHIGNNTYTHMFAFRP